MRLIFLFVVVCSLESYGQDNTGFVIKGQITHAEGKKIFIAPTAQASAIDSAVIRNGEFILKGKVKETDYFALLVEGQTAYLPFILSNARLKFTGNADSLRKAHIEGSKEIRDAQKLRDIIKPFFVSQSMSFDSAFAAYNRGDSIKGKAYEQQNVTITKRINDSIADFIMTHPSSYISLAQLNELHKSFGIVRSQKLYQSLSPSLKKHSVGKQLKYEIFEAYELTALNNKAIMFQQKDTAGRVVRLSDYKGKYVLIDFWASWCGPCRAENPNLKKAYERFHAKGFEVLGISLDNNKDAWVKALNNDLLPWKNVSDLNGFKNSVSKQYAVTELPTNFLLDPEGRIIAKNLKGDRLMENLHSLMDE